MTLSAALLDPAAPSQPSVHPGHQRGAYAIARDARGRILLVQTDNGRFYLPGGRIEAGESADEALVREIVEECGWEAEVGEPIHSAVQPIFGGAVRLEASYWEARLTGSVSDQPEHRLVWLKPAEAAARLHRAGDRQALALSQR
jgi:8-oxo-dGTP diphosphatase